MLCFPVHASETSLNHTVEYSVFGGYLVVLVLIGWLFRRLNKDVSDYFRAGCRGTWWLVGMSMLMSSISVGTFTANAGIAFEGGWSVTLVYLINAGCYLINFLFLAAWFRQIRVITFPEAVRDRFGPALEQCYAYFNAFTLLLFAGLQLYSLGVFANALFGLPVIGVIVTIGLVLVFYSVSGGSWAVMATDFVQGLIMMAMTITLTIFCLTQLGGVGGLFEQIAAQNLEADFQPIKTDTPDGKYGWGWIAGLALIQIAANLGMVNSVRFFAAKTGVEARKGAGLTMILLLVGAAFWFIPAITSRLLYADQVNAVDIANPPEAAFAIAALNLLPNGLLGLMMVAMFSASMSSLDSALNWNAGIFIRNLYPPLMRKLGRTPLDVENPRLVTLSRVFTVIFGMLVIGIAVYFRSSGGEGVFETGFAINAALALPMMIPLLLGVFIKRVPRWAGFASLGAGLASSVVIWALGLDLETHHKAIASATTATLAFLATMPLWKGVPEPEREKVETFFERMHRPVDFATEVGEANDALQLRMIGWFTTGMGVFIALLLIAPNEAIGRVAIASIAGFMLLFGGGMLLAAKRRDRTDAAETLSAETTNS